MVRYRERRVLAHDAMMAALLDERCDVSRGVVGGCAREGNEGSWIVGDVGALTALRLRMNLVSSKGDDFISFPSWPSHSLYVLSGAVSRTSYTIYYTYFFQHIQASSSSAQTRAIDA